MTALDRYDRLETTGVWRAHADAQRKDVVVSLGEATLVLSDTAGRVLTHWSLAAVIRQSATEGLVVYAPAESVDETLEVTDTMMIDAIDQVIGAIERRRPHPGRLRYGLTAAALLVVCLLITVWLPGAMVRYTASVVPDARLTDIGEALAADLSRVTGAACGTAAGQQVLARLHERLIPGAKGRLIVLPSGPRPTAHLPGGLILINRSLVEDHEAPEVVAGFILTEALRMSAEDPLARLLNRAGIRATAHLLTTGTLSDTARKTHAEEVLTLTPAPLADTTITDAFDAARLALSPYAYAMDVTGESVLALIEADLTRTPPAKDVLGTEDWETLQAICGN